MMKIKRLLILLLTAQFSSILIARSIHRSPNPTIPYITVTASNQEYAEKWVKSHKKPKTHKFQSKFLRLKTLKKPFENSNFKKYKLPYGYIKYRKSDESVHTNT